MRQMEKKKEVGRQHQGMDRPGVCKSQRAVENTEKWRKLAVKSYVLPPATLTVKGQVKVR